MSDRAERLLDLQRHTAGSAAETLVRAATARGYTVGATGPGAYRLVRTRRKMLVGKQTESVLAAVFEDRTGTKIRLVGTLDDAVVVQLVGGGPASPTPASPPAPQAPPAVSSPPSTASPQAPPQPAVPSQPSAPASLRPMADTEPPTGRPVTPPVPPVPTLITGPPAGSPGLPGGVDRTVARPARASGPELLLPDGRCIALTVPVVVGRDPDPSRGPAGATGVAVDDRSVSKTHLAVAATAGSVEVTDLHSTNGTGIAAAGTEVGCEPGVPTKVPPGAVIVAGDVRLVVRGV